MGDQLIGGGMERASEGPRKPTKQARFGRFSWIREWEAEVVGVEEGAG